MENIDFKDIVYSCRKTTIVDLRAKEDFKKEHYKSATNIELKDLEKSLDKLNPNKTIYLYCYNGNSSKEAQSFLISKGFNAVNINGGYNSIKKN